MTEGTKRRLAAIVSADVVGYSRLIGADETGTLATLRAHRTELVDPLIAEHGGRIVKTMGDGLLLEFPSVVGAVTCTLAVQAGMRDRNADQPADRRIAFRIGVNLGDIVIDGEDIHGDGVNVAARLQETCAPGGLALSGVAYESLGSLVDAAFEDGGPQEFKNIARPVQVWRWSPEGADSAPDAAAPSADLKLPDKPSIAVLAFENMSGDPEQEYFSDGITEDIITALSRYRWFFVIARNSTFTYKTRAVDVKQVATELGVRYVVEGSVRKIGNRVRITCQLIDAATGNHIWADRYDRELDDIFVLQDEITSAIVGAVEPELAEAERERAQQHQADVIGAWDLYQRGMWHTMRITAHDARRAAALFEEAMAAAPKFSPAYAGYGLVGSTAVIRGWMTDVEDLLSKSLDAAKKAVEIDPRDAFAHLVLGRVQLFSGHIDDAIAASQRSTELNANLALGWYILGFALLWADRSTEAIPNVDRAVRLSPNDPFRWGFEHIKGHACWALGDKEKAARYFASAGRYPNTDFWPYASLASVLHALGRHDEAKAAIATALTKQPKLTVSTIRNLLRHSRNTAKDEMLTGCAAVGLPQ